MYVPQCTCEGVCEAVCLCICSGVSQHVNSLACLVYVCACLHANERVLHLPVCLSMCTSEWFFCTFKRKLVAAGQLCRKKGKHCLSLELVI